MLSLAARLRTCSKQTLVVSSPSFPLITASTAFSTASTVLRLLPRPPLHTAASALLYPNLSAGGRLAAVRFSSRPSQSSKRSPDQIAERINHLLLTMPKDDRHLQTLQLQRMEKRNKRVFNQPSNIYWQVLGCGSPGSPTSLFLYTDHCRYIFNCGEASQRMTSQMNLPRALAQLEHVFITSRSWRNMGGLPGLCLSVRGAGGADITIHGPPGCMQIYEATKNFLLLLDFDVHSFDSSDGVFSDGAVRIDEIKLHRSSPKSPAPYKYDTWGRGDEGEEGGEPFPPYDTTVQAYICSFNPKPGKLDVNKCVELGVPPGPLLGKLKSGADVTLPDGRVVKSCDVVGDSAQSSSYIVLDIPDSEYLDSLGQATKLKRAQNLELVFHFSPPTVLQDVRYTDWMKALPASVKHVFLNENSSGMGLIDVSGYQARLRTISPAHFFPALPGTDTDPRDNFDIEKELFTTVSGLQRIQAKAGLKFNVRPERLAKYELESNMIFQEEAIRDEVLNGTAIQDGCERRRYVEGLKEDLAYVRRPDSPVSALLTTLKKGEEEEKIFPQVIFLGTGSSIPSKYRNVSSILVEVEEGSFFMLDCGEGTLSQLVRLYGTDRARQILRNLKGIYISHQHADHHLGIIGLILERENAFRLAGKEVEKLYIIATTRYSQFLTAYHQHFEPVLSNAIQIRCEHLIQFNELDEFGAKIADTKIQLLFPDTMTELCQHLGLSEIVSCRAVHCPHAFCITFRTKAGYKILYTGDTRPNEALVNLGREGGGPDLLIHEATMEHYMIYDAMIKKHSTFTEAIQSGREMGAKFTMLTHFSQRYCKLPALEEIEGEENVGIAFDNMIVHPGNLHKIHRLYPALKRVFWESVNEMEDRRTTYEYKYSVEDGGPDEEEDSEAAQLDDTTVLPSKVNEKKWLAEKLNKKWVNRQNFFKEVNKRKEKEIAAKRQQKLEEEKEAGEQEKVPLEEEKVVVNQQKRVGEKEREERVASKKSRAINQSSENL